MKKLLLAFATILCCNFIGQSQTKLQYSVHATHAGIDNPMSLCKYSDPGTEGANQKWDFSNLVFVTPFVGYVKESDFSEFNSLFPKANTLLTEFSSHFYLNVTEKEVDQYGYISADGKTKISYKTPFVKMKFPFSYGDIYSGILIGTYTNAANDESDISGNYTIEADAYGTLILPQNSVFNDVLRVKTSKEYTIKFKDGLQTVKIETYRWYNAFHRYPLMVLTRYTTTLGNNSNTEYQAAYNSNAIKTDNQDAILFSNENIELFPNPSTSILHLTFNSPVKGLVNFELFDASGKIANSFQKEIYFEGVQEFDLSEYISGLKAGQYILRINIGNTTLKKEFIKSSN